MDIGNKTVVYVVANLKQIGPTNQTLNIIRYSGMIHKCVVITLFEESNDTMIDEYIKNNIEVISMNLNRKTVFLNGVRKLRNYLKKNSIKLVHSWGTLADIVSYCSCKGLNTKHIITLRNFPIEDMTTRMNKYIGTLVANINLYILKNSKYVVACSKSIEKKMKDTYNYNHISSIQNGVDLEKFNDDERNIMRKQLNINDDEIIYISTGSFIPRKRIEETIIAFINSQSNNKKQLWFIGDGILFDEIKQKYSSYSNIKFLGKQKDVKKFLALADVFVSSSESEGLPNAVLEAIACNTPVVLSNIPQHIEILDEINGCGLAYRLGEINELKMIFENLEYKKIESMIKKCRFIKDSNLTMTKMGKKYGDYYESIY